MKDENIRVARFFKNAGSTPFFFSLGFRYKIYKMLPNTLKTRACN